MLTSGVLAVGISILPGAQVTLAAMEGSDAWRGVQGHTEFWPLVNRRAHALGGRRPVEDRGLRTAWGAFLASAARRPTLSATDALKAVVFLLAQVRPAAFPPETGIFESSTAARPDRNSQHLTLGR